MTPEFLEALRENTAEMRLLRGDLQRLRQDMTPVVAAVTAAGGVQGIVSALQRYGPMLGKLAGFLPKQG